MSDTLAPRLVNEALSDLSPERPEHCVRIGAQMVYVVLGTLDSTVHGSTDARLRRVYLQSSEVAAWTAAWLRAVLLHELAHIALTLQTRYAPVPYWYREGYANAVGGTVTCSDSAKVIAQLEIDQSAATGPLTSVTSALIRDLRGGDRLLTASAFAAMHLPPASAKTERFNAEIGREGFEHAIRKLTSNPSKTFLERWAQTTQEHLLRAAFPTC